MAKIGIYGFWRERLASTTIPAANTKTRCSFLSWGSASLYPRLLIPPPLGLFKNRKIHNAVRQISTDINPANISAAGHTLNRYAPQGLRYAPISTILQYPVDKLIGLWVYRLNMENVWSVEIQYFSRRPYFYRISTIFQPSSHP